ncbi:SDR family NAD(P)-dependent oxidoreductase [Streptacidiphilus sp. PAMC 29251]
MRDYVFAHGTAVVTGAASGIGAALAHGLAERGSHLALLDRDADGLDALVKDLGGQYPQLTVRSYTVDLGDAEATLRAAESVRADHERITLLINNAGVALAGRFDQLSVEEFEWVVDINFHAQVRLTHALLPMLYASPGAHLVNVSSLFGLIAPAGQSAYAASKFAVRGFTEALRHELPEKGVGVTGVHPGGIRTAIATNARVAAGVSAAEQSAGQRQFEKLLTIEPSAAAAQILEGVRRRRTRVLIGWSARIPDLLGRLLPGSYGRVLAVAMKNRGR